LLLQIGLIVEDMTLIFSPKEMIDILACLPSSTRDLQLLHALAKKTVLWNSDTLAASRELDSTQLERAFLQAGASASAATVEANPNGPTSRHR
jgi:hypothetical protein